MTDRFAAAPGVAELVHRLADCPDDFLAAPLVGSRGLVAVAAVVGDSLADLGAELPEEWIATLAPAQTDAAGENWLRACLVTCWLVSDSAVRGQVSGEQLLQFLNGDLRRTAALVRAERLVGDPDRREELARLLMRAAGVVPAGETLEQALDRLATLDSVTRTRVESEARAAEERSREVRAALERQRAEEAAARASRE
jgi:succinate dehydrogenase/fumarate reductase flavoprotein subunit